MTFLIIILLSLAYALFDFFGYNATKDGERLLLAYRVLQRVVKGAIIVGLFYFVGLKPALAFLFLGMFASHDLMYYAWAWIIGSLFKRFEKYKKETGFQFNRDVIPHLWWTPVGLYRKLRYGHGLIKPAEFLTQAGLGILIALGLSA